MLASLLIVPLINLSFGNLQSKRGVPWWNKAVLYNFDFALPPYNYLLQKLTISANPDNVIIGRKQWFFLGDAHNRTLSTKREGVLPEISANADNIAFAMQLRSQWFKSKGVKWVEVMICPDKDVVYSEFVPKWAQHAPISPTDALMKVSDPTLYFYPLQEMLSAKQNFSQSLYYKTDTHWNNIGGWLGYQALAKRIQAGLPEVHWLTKEQFKIREVESHDGGDLVNFLLLSPWIKDDYFKEEIIGHQQDPLEAVDYEKGQVITGDYHFSREPQILYRSPRALNHKRVLWLRDSFAHSMMPYVIPTFSDLLLVNYIHLDFTQLSKIVEEFKPEIVLISTVERDAFLPWFSFLSPPVVEYANSLKQVTLQTSPSEMHDLEQNQINLKYRVNPGFPFLIYQFDQNSATQNFHRLEFNYQCSEKATPANLTLRWRNATEEFSLRKSAALTLPTGATTLDLDKIPNWQRQPGMYQLKIDFEFPQGCSEFNFSDLRIN